MIETKSIPIVSYKAQGDSDRTRTGIAAVFGNIDAGDDITHPGAFTKTLSETRQRVVHLWNHNHGEVPTAKIVEIKEIGRPELPEEVLTAAPDATGGLQVKREYFKHDAANAVLEALDAESIREMSYAYNPIKYDFTEIDGKTVRNLREVALLDTSDVPWGMNPATWANMPKCLKRFMPLGAVVQQLEWQLEELKAGRRNNHLDQLMINGLHDIAIQLGCDSCEGKKEETPKSETAEAAIYSTSLAAQRLKLQELQLGLLTI